MNSDIRKRWILEIGFILLSFVLGLIVVLPIVNQGIKFDFIYYNIIYVIVATTIFRYIFFWEWSPLRKSKVAKVLLIFLVPMIFFPLLEGIHSFVEFCDQQGLQSLMPDLSIPKMNFFMRYIKIEYLFFGMSSFLGSLLLIVKMIRLLSRQIKNE